MIDVFIKWIVLMIGIEVAFFYLPTRILLAMRLFNDDEIEDTE